MCRLDLRGTGSSAGDATDEYPPAEQADLVEVIAWLAAQEWCNGNVGMFGTSYSGFNSLQIACERPPALKAVCAIYSSDDRWTDDVHWRGGALKLVDLVDYCHYMTPMTCCRPCPRCRATAGATSGGAGWRPASPGCCTWLREHRRRLLAARLGAARADGTGYERIECRGDAGRGLGRRLPQQLLPHDRRAAATPGSRTACSPVRGRTPTRRPRCPGRGSTSTSRWRPGSTRWLRNDGAGRRRTGSTSSCAPRPAPRPTSTCTTGSGPTDARSTRDHDRRRSTLDGPRVAHRRARRRHRRLDRLRRPPPLGPVRRPARATTPARCAGSGRADEVTIVGQPRVRLRVSADAPARLASVKLCDVFPDGTSALVTRGTLDLGFRDGLHGSRRPPLGPARSTTCAPARRLRLPARSGSDPPAEHRRRRLAEHRRSPGTGRAHRARRRARRCRCPRRDRTTRSSRPAPSTPPRTRPAPTGRSPTTCSAGPRPARCATARTTRRPTTGTRGRTTPGTWSSTGVPSRSGPAPTARIDSPGPGSTSGSPPR